jgi:hypothetical protein
MAEVRRHCMRCGRLGVPREQDGYEIWDCPANHGEIFRAALPPAAEPEAEAFESARAALPPPPKGADAGKKKPAPGEDLDEQTREKAGQQQ